MSDCTTSVVYTEARAREGVRNTSGFTQKRQAQGVPHLGLHCNRRVPQVGTSHSQHTFCVRSLVAVAHNESVRARADDESVHRRVDLPPQYVTREVRCSEYVTREVATRTTRIPGTAT